MTRLKLKKFRDSSRRLLQSGARVCDPQQLRQTEGIRNKLQRLKIGCAAAHRAALRFILPMLALPGRRESVRGLAQSKTLRVTESLRNARQRPGVRWPPPPLSIYRLKCANFFLAGLSCRSETQAERRRVQRRRGSSSSRNRRCDIGRRLPPKLRRCLSPSNAIFSTLRNLPMYQCFWWKW